jgi:hypothetical protein
MQSIIIILIIYCLIFYYLIYSLFILNNDIFTIKKRNNHYNTSSILINLSEQDYMNIIEIKINLNNTLFSREQSSKENTMNLSKLSEDKELFSEMLTKENTMNLSKLSEDKELFSEEQSSKENTSDKESIYIFNIKINLMNISEYYNWNLNYNNDSNLTQKFLYNNSISSNSDNLLNKLILFYEFELNILKQNKDKELFSGDSKENINYKNYYCILI